MEAKTSIQPFQHEAAALATELMREGLTPFEAARAAAEAIADVLMFAREYDAAAGGETWQQLQTWKAA